MPILPFLEKCDCECLWMNENFNETAGNVKKTKEKPSGELESSGSAADT